MTIYTARLERLLDQLAKAMHRLLLATERDDVAELQSARQAGMDAHTEAVERGTLPHKVPPLPAWFAERMHNDVWAFGLLLTTGRVLAIESIADLSQAADGSLWLDVELLQSWDVDQPTKKGWPELMTCPTDRTTCSVALAHVVCAVELADT
jgi:hypothetical protein